MLASGRGTSQKEKEHTTTQMVTGETYFFSNFHSMYLFFTGMRGILMLESSMVKASSSMALWTSTKETSSMAGEEFHQ